MKKEREKRFRTLTKGLRLGLSWKLEWEKVFGEKKWFRLREKRERGWDIWVWAKPCWTSERERYIYIYIYRKRISIDREGIKNKFSIDREVSRRYRRQKDLNRSRKYWAFIEQIETPKNWLDGLSYLLKGIEDKHKNLDRRGMYWVAIEL